MNVVFSLNFGATSSDWNFEVKDHRNDVFLNFWAENSPRQNEPPTAPGCAFPARWSIAFSIARILGSSAFVNSRKKGRAYLDNAALLMQTMFILHKIDCFAKNLPA